MTAASGGSLTEFFDGTQVLSSVDNFNVRSDNFFLGDLRFPTGDDVDVAEVIVYDNAIGAADRQGVEEYLTDKYFTPVPEPSTYVLIAIGLFGLAVLGRRSLLRI